MEWKPFTLDNVIYDLSHLDPFNLSITIPPKKDKPEQSYLLKVNFGLHCFSRKSKKGESIPRKLAYSDSRETRIFDMDRYEQSKLLPDIVKRIASQKCFQDGHGKFYVVKIVDADGVQRYYSVFFALSKAGKGSALNLFIITAHMRDIMPYAHKLKPIRFDVLVYNTKTKKAIKPARQKTKGPARSLLNRTLLEYSTLGCEPFLASCC
ncbi:MAG: hypothetical protein ACOYJ2_06200 [Rickettsiales bacterium]